MPTEVWAIELVLLASLLGSLGPIFLKKSAHDFSLNPFKLIKNFNLLIGLSFYALGTILFIPALKGGELSVLYPLIATTYIWVSLWSMKILKEKMNKFKWMGIAIIIVGITFIGLGSI
ncbi:MAG: EamA family transporter [Candidatus Woesearchaeota archaeon]|nr:EamA family transporter [Candidatus Woesearchaeota archaeon]